MGAGKGTLEHLDDAGIDRQPVSPRPFQKMHSEQAKLVEWFTERNARALFRI